MKISWSIGLVFLFSLFQYLISIAESSASLIYASSGGYSTTTQSALVTGLTGIDANSNIISQAYALVTNVWHYCLTFINCLTWNYPTFFQGNFIYLKPFFYALSIGFVFAVGSLLRGVHSS